MIGPNKMPIVLVQSTVINNCFTVSTPFNICSTFFHSPFDHNGMNVEGQYLQHMLHHYYLANLSSSSHSITLATNLRLSFSKRSSCPAIIGAFIGPSWSRNVIIFVLRLHLHPSLYGSTQKQRRRGRL